MSVDESWDSWSHSENEEVEVVGRLFGLIIAMGKGPQKSCPKCAKNIQKLPKVAKKSQKLP